MNDKLAMIADSIDLASDNEDLELLHSLLTSCAELIEHEESNERAILYFFIANCHNFISKLSLSEGDSTWSWRQENIVSEILNLRKSISEKGFPDLNIGLRCKVLTNMGNALSQLGRTIESTKYYNKVLALIPNFAMALGNKGIGLYYYSDFLYDPNHSVIMKFFASLELKNALNDALWDSGFRREVFEHFSEYLQDILETLDVVGYKENEDLNRWSLGNNDKETDYRQWSLNNKLFLNPLNDICCLSVAAQDVIHLPSHSYKIQDTPRFPNYFNILKQEYVTARFMHYNSVNSDEAHFSDNDVLLIDGFDEAIFSYRVEQLKASFRITYSIFDKIALFINDYLNLGLKESGVNFRSVWGQIKNKKFNLHPYFENHPNWPLRGLYYLSKDLFDPRFIDIAEPDAQALSELRNRAEHRFLTIQHYSAFTHNTENQLYIDFDSFEKKSLKLLTMAREALIYLSLAMYQEETLREEKRDDESMFVSMQSVPITKNGE